MELFPFFHQNAVPKKFDEDICSLPTEDLNGLLGAFAPLDEEFIKYNVIINVLFHFSCY